MSTNSDDSKRLEARMQQEIERCENRISDWGRFLSRDEFRRHLEAYARETMEYEKVNSQDRTFKLYIMAREAARLSQDIIEDGLSLNAQSAPDDEIPIICLHTHHSDVRLEVTQDHYQDPKRFFEDYQLMLRLKGSFEEHLLELSETELDESDEEDEGEAWKKNY